MGVHRLRCRHLRRVSVDFLVALQHGLLRPCSAFWPLALYSTKGIMHLCNNVPSLTLPHSLITHLSRHREKPKRPIQIWSMDVSKQVLSMLVAHICGVCHTDLVTIPCHLIQHIPV